MPKLTWGRIIDSMDHALGCILFQNNLRWRPDDVIKYRKIKVAYMRKKHNISVHFMVLLDPIILKVKTVVIIVKTNFLMGKINEK